MLPTFSDTAVRLADVLQSAAAAIQGTRATIPFAAGRSTVVIVVDGLGYDNLLERRGYARTLARQAISQGASSRILGGFPSTTVAQLTSLTTGVLPGEHGLVGYSVRDPQSGHVANLISGWSTSMRPTAWQPVPTIFERLADSGVPSFVFGPPEYERSDFSAAFLRGAVYRGVASIEDRLVEAVRQADSMACVVYAYVADVDAAGHKHGWQSGQWSEAVEEVDAAVASALRVRRQCAVVVTADHGMVDVSGPDDHLFIDECPGLSAQIVAVAGEPRCPQLYLRDGADATGVAEALRSWLPDGRATAVTRDELVASGWLGPVTDAAYARLGDVVVPCLDTRSAIYDRSSASRGSMRMVGQHGAFTEAELFVPLLVFG